MVGGASLLETSQWSEAGALRGVPLTCIDEKKVRELIGQDNVIVCRWRAVKELVRPSDERTKWLWLFEAG